MKDITPIKFKEANKKLTKPANMTDRECGDLWIFSDGKQCISYWKLSLIHKLKILIFGKIWLSVHSEYTQPPVWLSVNKTVFKKDKK